MELRYPVTVTLEGDPGEIAKILDVSYVMNLGGPIWRWQERDFHVRLVNVDTDRQKIPSINAKVVMTEVLHIEQPGKTA